MIEKKSRKLFDKQQGLTSKFNQVIENYLKELTTITEVIAANNFRYSLLLTFLMKRMISIFNLETVEKQTTINNRKLI